MVERFSTSETQARLGRFTWTSACRIAPLFVLTRRRFPRSSFSRSAPMTSITLVIGRSLAETECVYFRKSSYYQSQMRDFTNRPNQSLEPTAGRCEVHV